jgi:flagellar L-ring protein precursor FlgH
LTEGLLAMCATRLLGTAARLLPALAGALLAGCMLTAPKVEVLQPGAVRPSTPNPWASTPAAAPVASGAIYNPATYRGLFEDRRARLVGDVLTIQIQERHSAKQSSNSSLDRNGSLDAKIALVPGVNPASLSRAQVKGSSESAFAGKGETGTDNQFTGTIAVTVIDVLPNGNMVVAGEKQVGINQNVEALRFSGVVNPATVLPGNVVSSTQVADARLEVRGRGDIDRAQTTGWLARFFLSFLPI